MKADVPDKTKSPVTPAELAALRLLVNADLQAAAEVLQDCPVRALSKDDVLLAPGTGNPTLHLVLHGRLRVQLDSPWTEPVRFIEAGETVGEMSLIDEKPVTTYVVADAPTNVLGIGRETFWLLVYAEPVVARNLLLTVIERMRMNEAVTADSMELRRQHRRVVRVDDLTGLCNRYALMDLLRRQLLRSSMDVKPLALLIVDINDFRGFNACFGEAAGDQVLYAVAQTLLDRLRPTDIAARVAGDKFAIVLPECNEHGAQMVAGRLYEAIANAVIGLADHEILPSVTVSIGIAEMRAFEKAEELIEAAEQALDRAKSSGREVWAG